MLDTPLRGFTILLPKVSCTTEIFKTAAVMISCVNIHKDALLSRMFITQWMLLPREWLPSVATEQVKGWNKMTRSSSEAKFLFSFSFNLELHLVVKSASLTALKHRALDPLCQNRTATGQATCLPTCCPANTVYN